MLFFLSSFYIVFLAKHEHFISFLLPSPQSVHAKAEVKSLRERMEALRLEGKLTTKALENALSARSALVPQLQDAQVRTPLPFCLCSAAVLQTRGLDTSEVP